MNLGRSVKIKYFLIRFIFFFIIESRVCKGIFPVQLCSRTTLFVLCTYRKRSYVPVAFSWLSVNCLVDLQPLDSTNNVKSRYLTKQSYFPNKRKTKKFIFSIQTHRNIKRLISHTGDEDEN